MLKNDVYREIKTWKKPIHKSKAKLARVYLKVLKDTQIIGITGSVGKTLVQNTLNSVLSQKFKTVVGSENLDPTFRIPNTILKTKKWDKYLILEYGVEHPGDMDYYLSIVKPKIAVVTTISKTHTKYFKNEEGVYEEKLKLVKTLNKNDIALLNSNDKNVVKMANHTKAKILWFGKSKNSIIRISHFSQDLKGAKFRVHSNGKQAFVDWKIFGKHQLISAHIAATLGIYLGMTLKQIACGLSQTKPPKHRLNLIARKDLNIIDDTYNSSPIAAEEAVKTLIDLGKNLKKIAVLGEMKDLGKLSKSEHQNLGEKIAKSKINCLVTIGNEAKIIQESAMKNGFKNRAINVKNTKDATLELKRIVDKRSLVLVKGSRHSHLERIVLGLLEKPTKINCYNCGQLD
jgi:UDP-N-acetylmuramoyl-tripeptide--D-alanyl-D-alanine ligase